MVPGKSGDQVLKETLGKMSREKIEGLVYSASPFLLGSS